jgi:hypothetical protein
MKFVTFLNFKYLPQLLILLNSMRKFNIHKKLYVFALDDKTYDFVKKLGKDIKTIHISKLESNEINLAKKNRNKIEFIWTLTPFCVSFVLNNYEENIIYIDCDMQFQKYPKNIKKIHTDLIDKVILTPHFFDEYKKKLEVKYGRYCVQFLRFNKKYHKNLLVYWKKSVLKNCTMKAVDGNFADQKYLENFKIINPATVLENTDKDLFGGPWNMNSIDLTRTEIFHFSGLKFIGEKKFKIFDWSYLVFNMKIKKIYKKYINNFYESLLILKKFGFVYEDFKFETSIIEKIKFMITKKNIMVSK